MVRILLRNHIENWPTIKDMRRGLGSRREFQEKAEALTSQIVGEGGLFLFIGASQ